MLTEHKILSNPKLHFCMPEHFLLQFNCMPNKSLSYAVPNQFVCCICIMITLLKEILHIHMKYKYKNKGGNLEGSCSEIDCAQLSEK